MKKDFKSPMSTIPSRGHTLENNDLAEFDQNPQRSKRSQQVGTVTQFPAQKYLRIPGSVFYPEFIGEFWAKVKQVGGCLEWQSSLDDNGYGRVRVPHSRAHFRAHRVAYYMVYEEDPAEMFVCHSCDNPKCVNPEHLFLGTALQNNQDKMAKGRDRYADQRGHRNGNSKLSENDARQIIKLILEGKNNKQIAAVMPVGHALVSRIRVGRSWRALADSMGYVPKPSKQAPKSGKTAWRQR